MRNVLAVVRVSRTNPESGFLKKCEEGTPEQEGVKI